MRRIAILPPPLLALLASTAVAAVEPVAVDIKTIQNVTCSRPSRNGDTLAITYTGRLQSDGTIFDQNTSHERAFTFTLGENRVIQGWEQGLRAMCPGERRILTIPPELAYGDAATGAIPPNSTLVFEMELVDVVGVKQEELVFGPSTTATAVAAGIASDDEDDGDRKQAECRLLGPFALLVQAALGAVALLTLVWKRYRETPKRPWKIWIFDVSKQVIGSAILHVLNLAMSMLSTTDLMAASAKPDAEGRTPNPCSFYLLNLGIDTTVGVPVLYILLKILHALFLKTPLAQPPESIKSGNYSRPPRVTWYLKQLLIYSIGLVGMKLFVLFLFTILPWLPWIGDWALRWTNGNEALEITFALFIFPLIMNAVQYWIIDSFIMDKQRSASGGKGYEAVGQGDPHANGGAGGYDDDRDDDYDDDDDDARKGSAQVDEAPLNEVDPTPIPDR
ncbi:hypothetical protein K470DRAFT_277670 [Piedraia hortae CBS 480.64]|uniref:peptidylprolyl isomerase n=1 Tax=Piedraia hortae CBS 480.64 TaxID=1314780 RepID=A0A6A7BWV3_9PEZI|nr:hypothetical protein K470DRAFT_277670 [Piedraia hortae CBS 480.64]